MTLTCVDSPVRALVLRSRAVLPGMAGHLGTLSGRFMASAALLALAPFVGVALCVGARFKTDTRHGRWGRRIRVSRLQWRGRALPAMGAVGVLWAIASGEMAWVGPEARSWGRLNNREESDRRVSSAKPGAVSNWWVRQRTNVDYGTQVDVDREYLETRSWRGDLGILARSVLAALYGKNASEAPRTPEILGIPIDNVTMSEAIEAILAPASKTRRVSFVNVDCLNKATSDRDYADTLRTSDLRLGDGIGLRVAGRLLGIGIRQNVNGTDLFPQLCQRMADQGLKIFLLGGRPGVADGVAKWIAGRYPSLEVAGSRHGYFDRSEDRLVVDEINRSDADVVLVAFGAPLQEAWIRRHRDALQARTALGVGGLFDFYSGRIPRAPVWLRELGLEWTYRLYQEPSRLWRRYLVGNVVFLARVFAARYSTKGRAAHLQEA